MHAKILSFLVPLASVMTLPACGGTDRSGSDDTRRAADAAVVGAPDAAVVGAPDAAVVGTPDAAVVGAPDAASRDGGRGLTTGNHPRMYVDGDEIAAVLARVSDAQEPWTSAYARAIADANTALAVRPRSVRTEGSSSADYTVEEGRPDYFAAIDMGRAIRDLGIGYAMTGEARYADRAIELIDHWALNSGTAMNPRWTEAQSHIELSITMPGIFYGADLIWAYPGWSASNRAAFQAWVAAFAADVRGKRTGTSTNNFGDWRLVMLASAAVITEDSALLSYAFDHYRALVPNQIEASGSMGWERTRDTGLSYSTYAVNAIAQVAEIARHYDVDLYHFTDERGRGSLERAFDFHAGFATNPATWPRRQDRPFSGENTAAYEFAYLIWGKPEYLTVLERWGRPAYETRTSGPLTLTHARGAFSP